MKKLTKGSDKDILTQAINLFNELNIQYWIDSGALLGLVRDGQLLPWDDDIDIGVWQQGRDVLLNNTSRFSQNGILVSVQKYKGDIYGITLKKKKMKTASPIHIHVYYISGEFAWSPQVVACQSYPEPQPDWAKNNPSYMRTFLLWCKRKSLRALQGELGVMEKIAGLLFCLPIWGLLYVIKEPLDRIHWQNLWPFSLIYQIYTWIIPVCYFKELKTAQIGTFLCVIPKNAEAYLSFRYGNWQSTNRSWYYWRDDKALYHENPEAVIAKQKI